MAEHVSVQPAEVHDLLSRHLLADGFEFVLDLAASSGSRVVDARDGSTYLDFYNFFASSALGMNPPGIADDPAFLDKLGRVAANKVANSDVYTTEYAEFLETFARVVGDPELGHLFFIEGGALAVENALKVAFDWKSRRNEAAGHSPDLGGKILHLTQAFHGRSGYTMSLTNTDPAKVARYPKFDWPRIDVPAIRFPLDEHRAEVEAAEERALAQARQAFADNPSDVAAFICEPIQSEGGDNHLRPEFLQAMQQLVHEHDALFIVDEVQTGMGATGTAWAYQQLGLEPDIVAFSKKAQLGGIMAGRRVDEVSDNALQVPSRVGSTWGGGLIDMVRATRILEIIERDGVIAAARDNGHHLLDQLHDVTGRYPGLLSNARGRGLLAAVDLPDGDARDAVLAKLRHDEHVLALPSGPRSVRFRPNLSVTIDELDQGVAALERVVAALPGAGPA